MSSSLKRIGLGVNGLANKPDLKTRNIGMEIQSGPGRPLNRAVVITRLSKQGIQFTKRSEAYGWSVYLSPRHKVVTITSLRPTSRSFLTTFRLDYEQW
ncbi:hypothetical protein HZ326_10956 [Fusarium oxysporum f. sp. albedinis]|jgi:hypothetical protein|nr:hypothetical protein HZ326_10956 [Fusarium oxysporum f. sp. albedinis]